MLRRRREGGRGIGGERGKKEGRGDMCGADVYI